MLRVESTVTVPSRSRAELPTRLQSLKCSEATVNVSAARSRAMSRSRYRSQKPWRSWYATAMPSSGVPAGPATNVSCTGAAKIVPSGPRR
ncbi:hypothetical protein PSR1_01215 [Anaeromyxobacter sp. PSR-1]|nr:hypothetical protein PSR1_01215 [Anaeromyxobacter sp. PSR-1]